MPNTLLLDVAAWDLVLDANGNIAMATPPYALAQDAASAIKTFSDGGPNGIGECYWDTTIGIPYLTRILGKNPPLALVKTFMANAALTVPGLASALVFLTSNSDREISGQVQVTATPPTAAATAAANFTVFNPQGTG